MKLVPNPVIFEINTAVWLHELSRETGMPVTLLNIPDRKWDELARMNIHAVWLMGVWKRSQEGIKVSDSNQQNLADFRRALPDFVPEDNIGSPYCVKNYDADEHFGGNKGIEVARSKLAERKLGLILDFVPNHLAIDHPLAKSSPGSFICGSEDDYLSDPGSYVKIGDSVIACGKDPNYAPWQDVLQVNAFSPGLREFSISTLKKIASGCDGVRCDMAMLLLNQIFAQTWGQKAGVIPGQEYWNVVISEVKKEFPDFIFLAETYWDTEYTLQQLGFDFCYDKRLYDRLRTGDAGYIQAHLEAGITYQSKLIRFIENHDEERAVSVFGEEKEKAAALIICSVPGARLIHEGQAEGRSVHLPVFLNRRPDEDGSVSLRNFYDNLLEITGSVELRLGKWSLCKVSGWDDNRSCKNILSWIWRLENKICLIAVNYSPTASQGMVHLPDFEAAGHSWRLVDLFTQEHYIRNGDEISVSGLYVGLNPWDFHFFRLFRMI